MKNLFDLGVQELALQNLCITNGGYNNLIRKSSYPGNSLEIVTTSPIIGGPVAL